MTNDKSKISGSMGVLLEMDKEYKNKQAPRAHIEGLDMSALSVDSTSKAPTEKPSATKKVSKKNPATTRDSTTKRADDKFVTRLIPSEKIKPWKFADRPDSEFGDWDEFVKSIATSGVQIPIVVRSIGSDTFEVIAGRRRWKACLELGIDVPCLIQDLSDSEAASLQHLENYQRSNLSQWANAMSWGKLISSGVFKSQSALAVSIGVDRRVISDSMAYTRLPDKLVEAIGPMSKVGIKMARLLARLSEEESNLEKLCQVGELIRENKISVSKVAILCRTGTTKLDAKIYKANGVNCFSVRSDSNGTPVISLRKELLEHLSVEDCLNQLIKLAEGKVK